MAFKEWDELTPHEKILSFPSRHPHTFKCALYIWMVTGVDFKAIDIVMRRLGYLPMDVRLVSEDESMSIGAPTYANPEEP